MKVVDNPYRLKQLFGTVTDVLHMVIVVMNRILTTTTTVIMTMITITTIIGLTNKIFTNATYRTYNRYNKSLLH